MLKMENTLWIVIDGRKSEVNAVLAGEALKRAAREGGVRAEVEVQGPRGAHNPFTGSPAPGDRLLALGQAEPPLLWAGLPKTAAAIRDALEDAPGLLKTAAGPAEAPAASGDGKDPIKKAKSFLSGLFKN